VDLAAPEALPHPAHLRATGRERQPDQPGLSAQRVRPGHQVLEVQRWAGNSSELPPVVARCLCGKRSSCRRCSGHRRKRRTLAI